MADEVNIRVSESLLSKDLQRRRETTRLIVRTIGFLFSLVPVAFIAWKFDLLQFAPQQRPVAQGQKAPTIPPPTQQPPDKQSSRRLPPRRPPPAEPRISGADDDIVRTPLRIHPMLLEQPAQHSVALNLERSRQREPLPFDDRTQWRLVGIEGQKCELDPPTGELTGPIVLTILEPQPILLFLSFQSVKRDDASELFVQVEPTIGSDAGRTIPFTIERMDRIAKDFSKQGKAALATYNHLVAERNDLQTWVESPVLKPAIARNNAVYRIMEINKQLPSGERQIVALKVEYEATTALFEKAKQLHGSQLTFEKQPAESLKPQENL